MRLNEIWPEGHGVDREFWDKQKLWLLCDAAAITLGVDPRVYYDDRGTIDRSFHGGPKLAANSIPGLPNEIENLVIMAINGRLPVLNAHTDEDEDKANWCIRPADYWAAIGMDLKSVGNGTEVNPKRKTTYLRIIAALCAASNIDWTKEGSASKIEKKLEMIGEKVALNTIREILKEISEGIEAPKI